MRPFSREQRSEQEYRSVLFAPAIAVMNRLKYPRKFALISLLFILPLALVMYFLLSKMNSKLIRANFRGYFKRFMTAMAGANNTLLYSCSDLCSREKGRMGLPRARQVCYYFSGRYSSLCLKSQEGISSPFSPGCSLIS